MNTILSRDRSRLRGRILFIDPDVRRARALGDILRQHDGIDVEIVDSVAAALRSLAVRIPDLVLTSTFLAPADEAALTAHLTSCRPRGICRRLPFHTSSTRKKGRNRRRRARRS